MMKGNKQMKTLTNMSYPAFALVAFACFALAPQARATCQDACLPNLNTTHGENALLNNTTGGANTATGYFALLNNNAGFDNTASGANALYINTTGNYNTADGVNALYNNMTGGANTASDAYALFTNTTGIQNTANGSNALYASTTGSNNTASGSNALFGNRTGSNNTANGVNAMVSNRSGIYNTATGALALYGNIVGNYNVANGCYALYSNNGNYNMADGGYALYSNSTGVSNTAVGLDALYNNISGNNNTAVGVNALVSSTGSNNVGLGVNAGHDLSAGNGNVCIGAGVLGVAGESNTTRIRNIYSSVASGRAVYVNSDNKIGTLASSRRVKENIKPMDKASEAILALKPVSFRYKKEIDASGTPQFGLVAEEVAKVSPELITRDEKGNPQTVRYEAVNAMLLNEFLKEHRKVEQQRKDFEAALAQQQKQINALTAGLQKVSAELELRKSAPQTVCFPAIALREGGNNQ